MPLKSVGRFNRLLNVSESMDRIAKLNSQALVIFILRDPIERTHSAISWLRKVEKRTIPFDMQKKLAGLKSKNLFTRKGNYLSSLDANYYAQTILHAKKHFSNVMIIYFDDLVNNQIVVLNEIRHKFDLPPLDQSWQLLRPMSLRNRHTRNPLQHPFRSQIFRIKRYGLY